MNRRSSSLLHDYKPASTKKPSKPKALIWFGAGLGLPLALLALVSIISRPPAETPPAPVESAITATPDAAIEPDANVYESLVVEKRIYTETPSVLYEEFGGPFYDELTLTIGRGDTLDELFREHNLSASHLVQISRLNEAGKYFRSIKPGAELEIQHEDGKVATLYTRLDLTTGLKVTRMPTEFVEEIIEHPIETRVKMAYGMIENSLYLSGAEAGLTDRTIMNMAGIFGWDIDFVYDIRAGDSFYVQFEEIWQDGEYVMDGEILAAEFNNRDESFRAVRFVNDSGRVDYFTPEGRSMRKAFIRAPVDARVSSPFNPRRLHPVLNTVRPHRGVDYGAPAGTPIKAAGDGKVIFRGVQRGYGNTVILQHGGNITTLYAHMSQFQRGVGVGSRVRQGQIIGYVGSTGMVTGAHLHYEYRVNGVHRNPRTVKLPQAEPINSADRERFLADSAPVLNALDQFKQNRLSSVALSGE